MDALYTNRSRKEDFVEKAFEAYGRNCEVRIATPFFSSDDVINRFAERGCAIRLIVKLGAGTSADALSRALNNVDVQIRFFTNPRFHTKLYLFGRSACLVGSANLTLAGKRNNSEVVVLLPSEDPRFDELSILFEEYWESDEACALDRDTLERYRSLQRQNPPAISALDEAVKKAFGDHAPLNLGGGKPTELERERYARTFRKKRQEFESASKELEEIYQAAGVRLAPKLPLRFEIAQFLDFIRREDATSDSWRNEPLLGPEQRKSKAQAAMDRFRNADRSGLRDISERKLPKITSRLGSEEAIENSSADDIFDTLIEIWAFHDQLRYLGGQPQAKTEFFRENSVERVKKTLIFLLHASKPDPVTRMAHCIYDEEYKLDRFGEGCVQETFSWVADAPLCNGRAMKSLRWLGFKVSA